MSTVYNTLCHFILLSEIRVRHYATEESALSLWTGSNECHMSGGAKKNTDYSDKMSHTCIDYQTVN